MSIAAPGRTEKEVITEIFNRMDTALVRWTKAQPLRKVLRRFDPLVQVLGWIERLVDAVAEMDAEGGWIHSSALFPSQRADMLLHGAPELHRAVKTEVTCFLRTQVAGWERGLDHLPPARRDSYRRETIADDVINVIDRGNLAAFRNHMASRLDYCLVFTPRRTQLPLPALSEDDLAEFERQLHRKRTHSHSTTSSGSFSDAKISIGSQVTSSYARSIVL